MMDEDFVERRPADLEIYRRLDAFAQVRLAPDAAAMARIRTALMGQSLALADARAAALTTPAQLSVALPDRPAVAIPRPGRRAAAAVLAACLVVGIAAGSVAASQAGGPLYGTRMWIEAATLPSDPMARANAQLARLDARIQEVRIASGNGNAGAAEAALEAYAVIVADLDAQAAANSAVAASVEDDMARRQVVLIGLLDEVPAQAQDAIQHALQEGANALNGTGDDPHPGNSGAGGAGQGSQGSQSGSGSGGSGGSDSGGSGLGGSDSGGSGLGGSGSGGSGSGGAQTKDSGGTGSQPEPSDQPEPNRTPRTTKAPKPPAADPTPEREPATPIDPAGGNQDEYGGSSRQDESGGGPSGPGDDQGDG